MPLREGACIARYRSSWSWWSAVTLQVFFLCLSYLDEVDQYIYIAAHSVFNKILSVFSTEVSRDRYQATRRRKHQRVRVVQSLD